MESRPRGFHVADADAPPAELGPSYQRALNALRQNRPLRMHAGRATSARQMLSAPELEALRSVGAELAPWPAADAPDPITRTVADYMALLDSSHSTRDAARFLGVDVSRIRQRIREHSLYAVEYEGEWRLPRFQFEGKRVLPGLAQTLRAIPADLAALDVAEWFLSPNPDLEQGGEGRMLSPREWLLRGNDPAAVASIAALL